MDLPKTLSYKREGAWEVRQAELPRPLRQSRFISICHHSASQYPPSDIMPQLFWGGSGAYSPGRTSVSVTLLLPPEPQSMADASMW